MKKDSSLRLQSLAAILGLLTAAIALPAWSAERIQFFVGPFEPTIYVDDLETFAETGEIEPTLRPFANRLDSEQKESLRAFLNTSYDLSPIPVSQFTNSFLGEALLERAGQVIQTDSRLNGLKAVRASLILAAADGDGGFNTINIMRHFPGETIQLNFPLTKQIAAEGQQIFKERDKAVSGIKQMAQSQAATQGEIPFGDLQSSGPYRWQMETFTFQNSGRPTESQADLYTPAIATASPGSIPVVVISHGFASNEKTFSYLAEHLASHGYGVVALEHTETSAERVLRFFWGQDKAPDPIDLLLRPQDITAALDTLSAKQGKNDRSSINTTVSTTVKNLNLDSVGLLGQSLGGYTVLAAGGATIDWSSLSDDCGMISARPSLNLSMFVQCSLLNVPRETSLAVADSRVSAIIALNPLSSAIFGQSGLQNIDAPVMLVAGTDDYIAPALPEQIEPFSWLETEHKTLVVMEGGTHFSFLNREEMSAIPFSNSLTGPDPAQARPQVQALSLAFFNRHLQNQAEAEAFISQRYLNTFPTEPFQFSVVDSLAVE